MKKMIFGLAVILMLGISSGAVLSYLSDEDRITNRVLPGETKISLEEDYIPPEELYPGCVITKVPRIRNESSTPCYTRVFVCFSDSKAEDLCEPLEIQKGWTQKEDGYYYWEEILQPGEETLPLFREVVIREDAPEEELSPFELLIYAEAGWSTATDDVWKQMKN